MQKESNSFDEALAALTGIKTSDLNNITEESLKDCEQALSDIESRMLEE